MNHHQLAQLYLADNPVTRAGGQWLRYDARLSQETLDLEILRLIKKTHGLTPAQRVSGFDIAAVRNAIRTILEPYLADLVRAFAALPGARQGLTSWQAHGLLDVAPDHRETGRLLGSTRGFVVDGFAIHMEVPETGARIWRLEDAARPPHQALTA